MDRATSSLKLASIKKETEIYYYEHSSITLTSNLPFSGWESIFKNPMTTAAAIDRLVHHSIILELIFRVIG